jgi:uncharacterized membrane protein YpjA
VVMNILVYFVEGYIGIAGIMLIFSHLGMAVQGLLYSPFYRIKTWHVVIAAVWTLHNDVIDYVFFMMPSYRSLDQYMQEIGYFTFWLSILSIWIAYKFGVKNEKFTLNLQ